VNISMALCPTSYIRLFILLFVFCVGISTDVLFGDDGNQSTVPAKISQQPELVGCRLAPEIIALLEDEIKEGLKKRGIESRFARFTNYAGRTLDNSADRQGWSELAGNCRLSWYDKLYRNPLKATAETEQFTRELHQAVLAGHSGLGQVLDMSAEKLDWKKPQTQPPVQSASPEGALSAVKEAVTEARAAYLAALAPLSSAEIKQLQHNLYPVLTEQNQVGHTLSDRTSGRHLLDLLEKMDRTAIYSAARALMPLTDMRLLEQLQKLPDDGSITVEGTTGTIIKQIKIPAGDIIIGGKDKNVYELDKIPGVCAVIDLGGDDEYREGTVSSQRPVLVVIDLAGNDTYIATKPGAQGSAVLGISMLLDLEGSDVYRARDVAQGSTLGGVGILVDYAGNDVYAGIRRVQGQAIGGIGILIDREGNDRYHAAMWGQGFGGPLGFGLLDDLDGKDHYTLGGLYPNSFKPETPGYEGFGQGVGAGLRQVANGGVGVLLEGGGDDLYEYDYLAHGGGYWFGLGLIRDFGGNDHRLGGTKEEFYGGKRKESVYQRYACGWGCHYSLGFCFDDAGDDTYGGTVMGLGFAWDMSNGVLCDFAGNDRYEAARQNTQGNGAQAGLGILFDYAGNDVYLGQGQGYASPSVSYHSQSDCGGNFSFLADYGGKDEYGCGVKNNSYNQRGSEGGFVIDRPKQEEIKQQSDMLPVTKQKDGG
jgi:hypothetical protein